MAQTWWGTENVPSKQLRKELAAMIKHFTPERYCYVQTVPSWDKPFFIFTTKRDFHRKSGSNEKMYWQIGFRMLELDRETWSGEYELKILYSPNYPHAEPSAYLLTKIALPSQVRAVWSHDTSLGIHICLHDHEGNATTGWDPGSSTAATYGLWGVQWVRAYLHFRKTGNWPPAS